MDKLIEENILPVITGIKSWKSLSFLEKYRLVRRIVAYSIAIFLLTYYLIVVAVDC